ncbi:hypothetical protein P7F88_00930 [Vibrio hannami]|uniref:hypothetical protein n=1 Tax=Vibrio hannami TaxID=2717094 RepID=UPI0024106253|nr:hypothetical protein [Vibrio hannami]MDG3084729.1 hypothetical protein [Vibrio hannami]
MNSIDIYGIYIVIGIGLAFSFLLIFSDNLSDWCDKKQDEILKKKDSNAKN